MYAYPNKVQASVKDPLLEAVATILIVVIACGVVMIALKTIGEWAL